MGSRPCSAPKSLPKGMSSSWPTCTASAMLPASTGAPGRHCFKRRQAQRSSSTLSTSPWRPTSRAQSTEDHLARSSCDMCWTDLGLHGLHQLLGC